MSAVKTYLQRMAEIRGTGGATRETSYYSALENLLNSIGGGLKPKVICNGQLRNQGAGHPDFGLYTRTQCTGGVPRDGQGEVPERGVIEVKPLNDDTWQTAASEQCTRYFDRYRLVLVTNYRDFRLIGEAPNGDPSQRESYSLADDEASFWALAANPNGLSAERAAHFEEFLQRVMMNAAPLHRAEDVAWFLASYARDSLTTLEGRDATALEPLKEGLEDALGIQFDGSKGQHFFLSTLVQTLFYGIFSAWVIWARSGGTGRFDWRSAGYSLTVPMVRTLFEEIARPTRLQPLGIMNFLDRTGEALDRIDRQTFLGTFDTDQAVQHFYEPFLENFDPTLRKEMGVWYTPPEIVQYMVERVDRVLRTELGVEDGLADPNVFVLDPCCGTGAFMIEVLRRIERTLRDQGDDPLIGQDIKQAARERVFGFEIMSAPFVIAHWRIGAMLADLDAPLDPQRDERPAVYLTNALTGWDDDGSQSATQPRFPELQLEKDQAEHVKQEVPILVVLGNPPYNAYAGTSPDEEEGLVEPYKEGLRDVWGIKKYNLDDLYVRFFRIAERRIAQTGRGIVSYISNYSFSREPSFVVMREHLLESFDKFWVENMHGDRNKSEYAPDGRTSQTIFAIPGFSPGIRQGIVITLAVKSGEGSEEKIVRYRDDIDEASASDRRLQLLETLNEPDFDDNYEIANPQPWNRLALQPFDVSPEFLSWPTLEDVAAMEPLNGLMEKRGSTLISIDRETLSSRMQSFFDPEVRWNQFALQVPEMAKNASGHNAARARAAALELEAYDDSRIVRYTVRPFDTRFAYYTNVSTVWNRGRPELWDQLNNESRFLVTRPSGVANPEGRPLFFTRCLGDNDAQRGHSYYFPFNAVTAAQGMLGAASGPNLSERGRAYVDDLGLSLTNDGANDLVWLHALAFTNSPQYLEDNADGISVDWPRIALPDSAARLRDSASLGRTLADLLDTEARVANVTSGDIREHLRPLGVVSATDLRVTAGWGSRDSQGRVNPGIGSIEERDWTQEERDQLTEGFIAAGLDPDRAFELLGSPVDVFLNDETHWKAVPLKVWEFYIGGYQVIKKWLAYREEEILGRALHRDEAREVTSMVRRMTEIVLMTDQLDENYRQCRDSAWAW